MHLPHQQKVLKVWFLFPLSVSFPVIVLETQPNCCFCIYTYANYKSANTLWHYALKKENNFASNISCSSVTGLPICWAFLVALKVTSEFVACGCAWMCVYEYMNICMCPLTRVELFGRSAELSIFGYSVGYIRSFRWLPVFAEACSFRYAVRQTWKI